MGRLGQPRKLPNYAWLASDEASYSTGGDEVSGGVTI